MNDKEIKLQCLQLAQESCGKAASIEDILKLANKYWEFILGIY